MNTILIGLGITAGVVTGAALIPVALGFGTTGIVGGSIAAGIQSGIGNAVAGSAFSICQSLGMSGVFTAVASKAAVIGATAAGLLAL